MPLTFLSHQAVVLPLKIKAPRVTNGTALVLGSMAPDVEYFLRGYPTGLIGHTWPGQVIFCLPVTLALFWVVTRIIAEPAAAHLPQGGDFHLPDYGLIRFQPTGWAAWAIIALSALIGSASHVVLDRATDGWDGVAYHALAASRAWIAVNVGLWVVLAGITLALMRYIGRNDLLRRWAAERSGSQSDARTGRTAGDRTLPRASDADGTSGSAVAFWGWVALCAIAGAALGAYYRRPGFFLYEGAVWVHIWLCSVSGAFIGLVAASAAWRATRPRPVQLRGSQQ
jgi:hypothetical protein